MIDLDELKKRTTRHSVLGGHGLDVVNMHGSDFDALIAELSALRVRVAELERDARLGAAVREAVKRAHAYFGATHDRIIADAVINHIVEEEGSDAD